MLMHVALGHFICESHSLKECTVSYLQLVLVIPGVWIGKLAYLVKLLPKLTLASVFVVIHGSQSGDKSELPDVQFLN